MRRIVISACFLAVAAVSPASAITCKGNYQVQKDGSQIATPYCEDNHLAAVANEHGMGVSAGAVRANPSVKERACRFVGDDIRVRGTCAPYRPDGDSRFRMR